MYFADWCWPMCYQSSFSLSDEVRKRLGKFGAIIDSAEAPPTGRPVHQGLQPDTLWESFEQIPYTIKTLRRFINGIRYPCWTKADTNMRSSHHGHTASDGCPHCGERDTFMHFYSIWDHSHDVQPGEVESPHIMLGDSRTPSSFESFLQSLSTSSTLLDGIGTKSQIQLPTPYLLAREVSSHFKCRLRGLPDGELLMGMELGSFGFEIPSFYLSLYI
ncbi:BZ3500_MvSof-1268-A1-R1_Chr1-3g01933 [Microbotryum saponariae]|uniref:BZ3500_MvSof-1268-A1-R1_Chr1-3g01933 protein n=1 Tax=Microbotryum saponariae TaxID=289078 RepID=A0A2X0KBX8_9BASI|nr:BZ3500_MvSof-1268-A1-R1_Chr1-3g01933 [Microbotryum saponariae]SCZ94938.1 BZ3501_MvSof-1269-A2-R1_Chr1-3g01535 [Microbotryum saponariae]